MSISSFAELGNTKLSDAVPLPLIPEGHYTCQIIGPMKERKTAKNLAAQYPLKLISPEDDVDQEELLAAGGIPDKSYPYDFWMSENARFMFGDFCRSLSYSDELGLVECLEKVGAEMPVCVVEVKHEAMQDKDGQPLLNADGTPRKRVRLEGLVGADG